MITTTIQKTLGTDCQIKKKKKYANIHKVSEVEIEFHSMSLDEISQTDNTNRQTKKKTKLKNI